MALTFKEYLVRYEESNSPNGDFAMDVKIDPYFPIENDYEIILNYLYDKRALKIVINIFKLLFKRYKKTMKNKK